jgi:hypothetical protein
MSKVQHLRDQAAKAERLARSVMDTLTAERLLAVSREYRLRAEELTAKSG